MKIRDQEETREKIPEDSSNKTLIFISFLLSSYLFGKLYLEEDFVSLILVGSKLSKAFVLKLLVFLLMMDCY